MNIFKKVLDVFKEDTPPPKSKETENKEIIDAYNQIKRAVPNYDEPNYTLAEKVFREFNNFNLKNINEINHMYLGFIPKSLLPYPKNYIKCAYYIFLENAKKQNNVEMYKAIQGVSASLFFGNYPDYASYQEKIKSGKKEFMDKALDDIKARELFKKMYGVYEISEEDYNSSLSSIDSTNEKLIYDFGVLPEIEEDVDFDKISQNIKNN